MIRYLLKNLISIVLSLILAVLVWITAVREQNPFREDDYNHPVPLQVIPPPPGLVTIDPLPETVQLRLRAPESSWVTLTPTKFKATLDLSGLPAGFNDVPVRVEATDSRIEIIERTPRAVRVDLQAEQTISRPVRVVVMDNAPVGYFYRTPVAAPAMITITGPASLISRADKAVSEIFIRNAKEPIERTLPISIRTRDDQLLNGLTLTPDKVQITVPIEQRFDYKEVSVRAVIEDQPATGYWVSNISVEPSTLTIVGNPNVLKRISGFIQTAPINLRDTTSDIVQVVPLDLPDGVTVAQGAEGVGGVKVKVQIASIESGKTFQRPVAQQGIDPDYSWQASPAAIDVIVSGPIPRLQTVRPTDIKVIVDLFKLTPGPHKIKPTIFLPDGLRVEATLPDLVQITITPRLTPTTEFTPTHLTPNEETP